MLPKINRSALSILICLAMLVFLPVNAPARQPAKSSVHKAKNNIHNGSVPGGVVIRSAAALVEDQRTGELLLQKKAHAVVPIASITKLMTAMVVLDSGSDLNELITIEATDIDTFRHSYSRLPVGAQLTRGDLLLISLMASDNRSAHALGRVYPGGVAACVAAMNDKARSLGLFKTRFVDTTGLFSGNVSSARDLARLVGAAYSYPLIREFSTCREAVIDSGARVLEFRNTNRLLSNPDWEIGLSKTGYIDESGRCLVMQVRLAERSLFIVLLDSQGKLTRIGDANRIKKWLEDSGTDLRTSRSSSRTEPAG
jgi:D-alanyl-D-alanine endopeptidase (penicillin-binding protein 7)